MDAGDVHGKQRNGTQRVLRTASQPNGICAARSEYVIEVYNRSIGDAERKKKTAIYKRPGGAQKFTKRPRPEGAGHQAREVGEQ
jgi:hypothetical protein